MQWFIKDEPLTVYIRLYQDSKGQMVPTTCWRINDNNPIQNTVLKIIERAAHYFLIDCSCMVR